MGLHQPSAAVLLRGGRAGRGWRDPGRRQMRRSACADPASVPDYRALIMEGLLHSTPPVTARLRTAAVPSLWSAPGREPTGFTGARPSGPTTPEDSGNWTWLCPSMSLADWHGPSAEGSCISTDWVQIGRSRRTRPSGQRVDAASGWPGGQVSPNAASTASPLTRVRAQRAGPFGRQPTARGAAP
jgi:hypothetical protein